ncbi:hypothetical protein JCM5353_008999 [Sporobolomyces roseus]
MPPREPYTLPKDFDKYTAGYASFETKLKVLGGYSIPFAHTGKRQRQRQYGEYYSFPSWKARFSIALHGWVREQGSQLEERARDQQEVILWSSMGMQIQKLVYLMHRELEKKRKGEMGAKVWSLADLFLHFSEIEEVLKHLPEPSMLVDITNKPPVNHAHSLGQMSLSRLSHRQRQIYVGNVL